MKQIDKEFEAYITKIQDKQREIEKAIRQQSENYDKCEEFNQRVAKNNYVLQGNEAQEERDLYNKLKNSLSNIETLIKELKDIIH